VKDLFITIVEQNKYFTIKTKLLLNQEEYTNIKTFNSLNQFEKFIESNTPDIVIIHKNLFKKELLKKLPETIFLIISDEIEITENIQVLYIPENFSDKELMQELHTISLLKRYEKETKEKTKELKQTLKYIQKQESIAASKQLNMIFDNVSFQKLNDVLIDSYFSPKDKLSGDSYVAFKKEDKLYILITDAMGKGIGAAFTSTIISALGNFVLKRALNLEEFITEFISYAKKVLLENEALCLVLFELDLSNSELQIANFGMPPIYLQIDGEIKKVKSNNSAVFKNFSQKIKVDYIKCNFEKIVIFTDGLIESPLKDKEIPYFARFKSTVKESLFLRELLKDFKKHANQDDDVTIFFLTKEQNFPETLFEKEIVFKEKRDLDDIITKIDETINDSSFIKQQIFLTLQEMFLNIMEHAYGKLDKQSAIENEEEISIKGGWLKVSVMKNDLYYKIVIEDRGKGFDATEVLRSESEIDFKRYHKRGLLMLLNSVSGLFFENNGTKAHIYIRRANAN